MSETTGMREHIRALDQLAAVGRSTSYTPDEYVEAFNAAAREIEWEDLALEAGLLPENETVALSDLVGRAREIVGGLEAAGLLSDLAARRQALLQAQEQIGPVGGPRKDLAERRTQADEQLVIAAIAAGGISAHERDKYMTVLGGPHRDEMRPALVAMAANPRPDRMSSMSGGVVALPTEDDSLLVDRAEAILAAKGVDPKTATEEQYMGALEAAQAQDRQQAAKAELDEAIKETKAGPDGYAVHQETLRVLADRGQTRYGASAYRNAVVAGRRRVQMLSARGA